VAALAEMKRKKKLEERAQEAPPPQPTPTPTPQPQPAQPQTGNLEPTLQPPPTPAEERAAAHDQFVRGKKRDRLITMVVGGATVAFLAVAVGLSADALVRENKYHSAVYPSDKSRLQSEATVRANVADGFWVGTAVAAGVTGYFAWRAFLRKEPAESRVALVPMMGPTGGGLAAVGRF
jgi:hypothetical protein